MKINDSNSFIIAVVGLYVIFRGLYGCRETLPGRTWLGYFFHLQVVITVPEISTGELYLQILLIILCVKMSMGLKSGFDLFFLVSVVKYLCLLVLI